MTKIIIFDYNLVIYLNFVSSMLSALSLQICIKMTLLKCSTFIGPSYSRSQRQKICHNDSSKLYCVVVSREVLIGRLFYFANLKSWANINMYYESQLQGVIKWPCTVPPSSPKLWGRGPCMPSPLTPITTVVLC